jgi:hypothetical protein
MPVGEKKGHDVEFLERIGSPEDQETTSEGTFDGLNETEIKALEKRRTYLFTLALWWSNIFSRSQDRLPSYCSTVRPFRLQYP